MVIPMMIPIGSGGGGYVGPNIDITDWDMPILPTGWKWQVTDSGGRAGVPFRGMLGFLFGNPCIVWLYPQPFTFVDAEHDVQRSRSEIKRAAEAIVRRSIDRAGVDNRFTPFVTGKNT